MYTLSKNFTKLFVLTLAFFVTSCNMNPTNTNYSEKAFEKPNIKIITGKNNLSFKTKSTLERLENDNYKIKYTDTWKTITDSNASAGTYTEPENLSVSTVGSADSNSNLTYYGNWQEQSNTDAYNASYKFANPDSYFTLIQSDSSSSDLQYSDSWKSASDRKYIESEPTIIDDKSSSLTYSGTGWSQNSQSHTSKTKSDYIQIPFSGTNLDIYGSKNSTSGKVTVTVTNASSGTVEKTISSVDLYSAELIKSTSLVKIQGLTNGNHIAKIEVLAEKNTDSTAYNFEFDNALSYPFIQYKFTGTNIYYSALKDMKGGKVYVTVDDKTPQLVDLYSSVSSFEVLAGNSSLSLSSQHTITIEGTSETNTDSLGNFINFQKFVSMPYLTNKFSETSFSLRYFEAPNYGKASLFVFDDDGSGKYTTVSTAIVNGVARTFPYEIDMYNATNTFNTVSVSGLSTTSNHLFVLVPEKEKNTNSSDYLISFDYANIGMPQLSYTVNAKSLYIVGKSSSDQGKMIVRVNGGTPTIVNLYNPTTVWQSNLFELSNLDVSTATTITIEPAYEKDANSTGYGINFDAFISNVPPEVYSILPNYGKIGDSIIISGANFSTVLSENIVKFGDIQATVTEIHDDYMKVTVPDSAVTGTISVETPMGTSTITTSFIILGDVPLDTITNISRTSKSSNNASVGVGVDGIIHAVWEDKTTDNLGVDIFYTSWDKTSWAEDIINVTTSAAAEIASKNPSIAVDNNGNKHMVFSLGNNVFYTYSPVGSNGWEFPPILVSDSSTNKSTPKIAIGASKLHVVWESDSEIYYSQSSSGTRDSWSDPVNISSSDLNSSNPSIAVDGRDIPYVVWQDNSSNLIYHIYYSRVIDPTDITQWTENYDVTGSSSLVPGKMPTISLDNASEPSVAWEQSSLTGFTNIYYSKNPDREATKTWTTPINITNTTLTNCVKPQIVTDSLGYSYIVWQDGNLKKIYLNRQTSITNNTWGSSVMLSPSDTSTYIISSLNPSASMDYLRNTINVVWESNKDDPTYDIYHIQKACNSNSSITNRIAVLNTNKGIIKMQLYEDKMPITTSNFIKLVNSNFYNGLTFHRYLENFVIQGGDPLGTGLGGSSEAILLETNRTVKFDSIGVVGMARSTSPDTATSQFFITLDASNNLNGSYSAFAKVFTGFDVLLSLRKDDIINSITIENP